MTFRSLLADLVLGGTLNNAYELAGSFTVGQAGGVSIVIDGAHDAILFYDSGGHLLASLAPAAGNDGLGNSFPLGLHVGKSGSAGVVAGLSGSTGLIYFPGVVANVQNDASLQLNHQGAGNAAQSFLTIGSAQDNVQLDSVASNWVASSHDGTAKAQISEAYIDSTGAAHFYRHLSYSGCVIDVGLITGVDPATGTAPGTPAAAETWHAMTLGNGWANRGGVFVTAQYRRTALKELEIVGEISGGTITSGTVVATLPAAYRPAHTFDIPVVVAATGTQTNSPTLEVASDGTIKVASMPTGTTVIAFCATIPLDA